MADSGPIMFRTGNPHLSNIHNVPCAGGTFYTKNDVVRLCCPMTLCVKCYCGVIVKCYHGVVVKYYCGIVKCKCVVVKCYCDVLL